ncbi:hypothetical protein LINPERHAP2_LOCUS37821, partial [Linum perenne]
MHEKLLTNLEHKRRHLTENVGCIRCGGEESILHVLRDCPFASQVWNELNPTHTDMNWWLLELNDWLLGLIKHESNMLLGITCRYLWKARNELIFEDADQSTSSLVRKITTWVAVVMRVVGCMNQSRLLSMGKARVDIAWEPGPCSITRAELRGVAIGLKLAWEAGARKVVVQADSRAAIALIEAKGSPSHQHAGIKDGRDTNFWSARLIDLGERLRDLVARPDCIADEGARVCEFGNGDGDWDMDKLCHSLPEVVVAKVVGVSPPIVDRGKDTWALGEESNGQFSTRSAYDLISYADQSTSSLVRKITTWVAVVMRVVGCMNQSRLLSMGKARVDIAWEPGPCSITRAELRGVAIGLKLDWEAGARKVVVQADSRAAIALIEAKGSPSHQHA